MIVKCKECGLDMLEYYDSTELCVECFRKEYSERVCEENKFGIYGRLALIEIDDTVESLESDYTKHDAELILDKDEKEELARQLYEDNEDVWEDLSNRSHEIVSDKIEEKRNYINKRNNA
ncbi:MAG: hypothetical protein LBD23_05450 [Oscillospiraceae bacterium]|jgi:hypothetical protein|nr:hypothetical protein [Oscillospiraceae bacterium]